jgi:maltooligosyltrehalose trehalohydrolase
VDPWTFQWTDGRWSGPDREGLVIYQLHVGTFSPEGTYRGVIDRLPYLRDLGVTAIQLMPVAEFPGRWNWGHDGAAPFAPASRYGRPDELRALVDAAHRLGLAVLLDLVYRHPGPDGGSLPAFIPPVFVPDPPPRWGPALDVDGPYSRQIRDTLIENAIHWLSEYHLDGLRVDASHVVIDRSRRRFLAELSRRAHAALGERTVLLLADDGRNLPFLARPEAAGGCGLDAIWASDFHHQVRRALVGEGDAPSPDFTGSLSDLARTIGQGWFSTGQVSSYFGGPRGSDPGTLPPHAFVIFLQDHAQIGNRAFGERLHHQIELAAYRAASVLLLCAPETPVLFMGQEWAAKSPFLFFTDHDAELGALVTAGRRNEFRQVAAFADPGAREEIPDPQDPATFRRSRLDWTEADREPHASLLRLYRALLDLRRREPLLRSPEWTGFRAAAVDDRGLVLWRTGQSAALLVLVAPRAGGVLDPVAAGIPRAEVEAFDWRVSLTTEDAGFAPDPAPPSRADGGAVLEFRRPGAAILLGSRRTRPFSPRIARPDPR